MSTINSKLIWCLETLCLRERSRSSESKFYWELFKLPQHHPPSFRNSDAKQAQLFPFQTLQQVDCWLFYFGYSFVLYYSDLFVLCDI